MKGVIFDLDGVLIDSRENMSYAWSMVKHHCKIDISFEKYFNEISPILFQIHKITYISFLQNQ